MNYHDIEKDSMLNGEGIRTVLWVSGCNHGCKGCQNPSTWDPNDGLPFDEKAKEELWHYIDMDYCSGLTLSGGDPMFPSNREAVTEICREFRERYGWGKKTIWMYTGYSLNEIRNVKAMDYIDLVVDGPFVEALSDVKYCWAGSTNQGIWRHNRGVGTFDVWIKDPPTWASDLEEKDQKGECKIGC